MLHKGQLQLSPNHTIPLAEDLKKKRYGKFHNLISHDTNDCKIFCHQIQSDIDQGKIKFDENKKSMKIDGHPFLAEINMVDFKGKEKVLTSARAKET